MSKRLPAKHTTLPQQQMTLPPKMPTWNRRPPPSDQNDYDEAEDQQTDENPEPRLKSYSPPLRNASRSAYLKQRRRSLSQSKGVLQQPQNSLKPTPSSNLAQYYDGEQPDQGAAVLKQTLNENIGKGVKLRTTKGRKLTNELILLRKNPGLLKEQEIVLTAPLNERRHGYSVKNYRMLSLIPSWSAVDLSRLLQRPRATKSKKQKSKKAAYDEADEPPEYEILQQSSVKPLFLYDVDLNDRVSLIMDDISRLELDAIVFSCMSRLNVVDAMKNIVDKAQFLEDELKALREAGNTVGKKVSIMNQNVVAHICCGYKLPAYYAILTRGPIGDGGNADKLRASYEEALAVAERFDVRTISIHILSHYTTTMLGIGYDHQAACHVALKTIRQYLEKKRNKFDRIVFCCYSPMDWEVYCRTMLVYFPVTTENSVLNFDCVWQPLRLLQEKASGGVLKNVATLNLTSTFWVTDMFFWMIYHSVGKEVAPYMKTVNCSGCFELTDLAVYCMAKCFPNIEEVSLDCCVRITERGLAALNEQACPKLRVVSMKACNVRFRPTHVKRLHQLTLLGCPLLDSEDALQLLNSLDKQPISPSLKIVQISTNPDITFRTVGRVVKLKNGQSLHCCIVECHEGLAHLFQSTSCVFVAESTDSAAAINAAFSLMQLEADCVVLIGLRPNSTINTPDPKPFNQLAKLMSTVMEKDSATQSALAHLYAQQFMYSEMKRVRTFIRDKNFMNQDVVADLLANQLDLLQECASMTNCVEFPEIAKILPKLRKRFTGMAVNIQSDDVINFIADDLLKLSSNRDRCTQALFQLLHERGHVLWLPATDWVVLLGTDAFRDALSSLRSQLNSCPLREKHIPWLPKDAHTFALVNLIQYLTGTFDRNSTEDDCAQVHAFVVALKKAGAYCHIQEPWMNDPVPLPVGVLSYALPVANNAAIDFCWPKHWEDSDQELCWMYQLAGPTPPGLLVRIFNEFMRFAVPVLLWEKGFIAQFGAVEILVQIVLNPPKLTAERCVQFAMRTLSVDQLRTNKVVKQGDEDVMITSCQNMLNNALVTCFKLFRLVLEAQFMRSHVFAQPIVQCPTCRVDERVHYYDIRPPAPSDDTSAETDYATCTTFPLFRFTRKDLCIDGTLAVKNVHHIQESIQLRNHINQYCTMCRVPIVLDVYSYRCTLCQMCNECVNVLKKHHLVLYPFVRGSGFEAFEPADDESTSTNIFTMKCCPFLLTFSFSEALLSGGLVSARFVVLTKPEDLWFCAYERSAHLQAMMRLSEIAHVGSVVTVSYRWASAPFSCELLLMCNGKVRTFEASGSAPCAIRFSRSDSAICVLQTDAQLSMCKMEVGMLLESSDPSVIKEQEKLRKMPASNEDTIRKNFTITTLQVKRFAPNGELLMSIVKKSSKETENNDNDDDDDGSSNKGNQVRDFIDSEELHPLGWHEYMVSDEEKTGVKSVQNTETENADEMVAVPSGFFTRTQCRGFKDFVVARIPQFDVSLMENVGPAKVSLVTKCQEMFLASAHCAVLYEQGRNRLSPTKDSVRTFCIFLPQNPNLYAARRLTHNLKLSEHRLSLLEIAENGIVCMPPSDNAEKYLNTFAKKTAPFKTDVRERATVNVYEAGSVPLDSTKDVPTMLNNTKFVKGLTSSSNTLLSFLVCIGGQELLEYLQLVCWTKFGQQTAAPNGQVSKVEGKKASAVSMPSVCWSREETEVMYRSIRVLLCTLSLLLNAMRKANLTQVFTTECGAPAMVQLSDWLTTTVNRASSTAVTRTYCLFVAATMPVDVQPYIFLNSLMLIQESTRDLWRPSDDGLVALLDTVAQTCCFLCTLVVRSMPLKRLPDSLALLQPSLQYIEFLAAPFTSFPQVVCRLTNLRQLTLKACNIRVVPECIGNLTQLLLLDLASNPLEKLPDGLRHLQQLKCLTLDGVPWFTEEQTLSMDQFLNKVYQNGVVAIMEKYEENNGTIPLDRLERDKNLATWLENEFLGKEALGFAANAVQGEQIASLNDILHNIVSRLNENTLNPSIATLTSLEQLQLDFQLLEHVPEWVGKLQRLQVLSVRHNTRLTRIHEMLGSLQNLSTIKLMGCKKLTTPPPEIVRKGSATVMAFLRRMMQGFQACRRTKLMLVGLGGAGKTSLVKAFLTGQYKTEGTAKAEVTDGIDIDEWTVKTSKGNVIQYSVWDFAGQAVYYNTHQFFISTRAVYFFLWNTRLGHEHAGLDFWLSSITCHAPKAKIFIIGTHCDEVPRADIPKDELRKAFPGIVDFYYISTLKGDGVRELADDLWEVTCQEDYMSEASLIPKVYLNFEKQLIKYRAEEKSILALADVEKFAENHTISGTAEVRQALNFLHDLGSIQYFDKEFLRNRIVISPQWLVDAMACLVTVKHSAIKEGRFERQDINVIWDKYPEDLRTWLLSLTEEFDLTFRLSGSNTSIVPCLLPEEEPAEYIWPDLLDDLREMKLVYTFQYLPAGLFNRTQSRLCSFSDVAAIWKRGALVKRNQHLALVQQSQDKELVIKVQGASPENVLFLIYEVVEGLIAESFYGVRYDILLPCLDCVRSGSQDPHMFSKQLIRKADDLKAPFLQCCKQFHILGTAALRNILPPTSSQEYNSYFESKIRELDDLRDKMDTDVCILCCQKDIHTNQVKPKERRRSLKNAGADDQTASTKPICPTQIQKDLQREKFSCHLISSANYTDLQRIGVELMQAQVIVVCVSNEFAGDEGAYRLFTYAKNSLKKHVIPVVIGTGDQWKMTSLGMMLVATFYIDMQKTHRYETKLTGLVADIRKHVLAKPLQEDYAPVFMSYCWANSKQAVDTGTRLVDGALGEVDPRDLCEFVTKECGFKCWIDVQKYFGGAGLFERIADSLRRARVMLACVSDQYVLSDTCMKELRFATDVLKIEVILCPVGMGNAWQKSEAVMLALKAERFSFQVKSEATFTALKTRLQELLRTTDITRPKSGKPGSAKLKPSRNNEDCSKESNSARITVQELCELTQRKFLEQLQPIAREAANLLAFKRTYPRLYFLDFENAPRVAFSPGMNANDNAVVGVTLSQMFTINDAVIRLLCESERGWHLVEEHVKLQQDEEEGKELQPEAVSKARNVLDAFEKASTQAVHYLVKLYTILEHSAIPTQISRHKNYEQIKVAMVAAAESVSLATSYGSMLELVKAVASSSAGAFRGKAFDGSLARSYMASHKVLWLCAQHQAEARGTLDDEILGVEDVDLTIHTASAFGIKPVTSAKQPPTRHASTTLSDAADVQNEDEQEPQSNDALTQALAEATEVLEAADATEQRDVPQRNQSLTRGGLQTLSNSERSPSAQSRKLKLCTVV